MYLTLKRGILTTNCDWWYISDYFKDATGINLFNKFKRQDKIVPIYTFGKTINVVTDINFIKKILVQSPFIFGVGDFKYNFFKSFMSANVGVSQGCPWSKRRAFNEYILSSNDLHPYHDFINRSIRNIVSKNLSNKYDLKVFSKLGKLISSKIVFNDDIINKDIYQLISNANSFNAITIGHVQLNEELHSKYKNYILQNIRSPKANSLMSLIKKYNIGLSESEVLDQVPHWIFPINGIISIVSLRLLLLLANHPKVLNKVITEINSIDTLDSKEIDRLPYLRKCILELCRLNNPVNSTFRTLLFDYSFDKGYNYKKGDQFLILNSPILRDDTVFQNPNIFNPDRWTDKLEHSYYSLMFNQGSQRCPGKELSIYIIKCYIIHFIKLNQVNKDNISGDKLNVNYIPQAINPCDISIVVL
jgi:hypothetical protein